MNQKIIIIEPPYFILDEFERMAKAEGDDLYVISHEEKYLNNEKALPCDIRKEINLAKELITQKVGKPSAIITASEMYITQAAELGREFGTLRDSVDVIRASRDKDRMKETWIAKGVNTPKGMFYRSADSLKNGPRNWEYPVIIKPSLGYASCGVKRVDNDSELFEQLGKITLLNSMVFAKERLENMGFLVEEYIDGEEYSVDTLWYNGKPLCNGILSKGNASGPYYPDRLYYIDPQLSEAIKSKAFEASHQAVTAIGLNYGATHTEMRFKNGKFYVLESASRPGAGGYFYYLFEKAYGLNFFEIYYLIHSCPNEAEFWRRFEGLGKFKPVEEMYYFFYNIPFAKEGIIKSIEGIEDLRQSPGIFNLICFKKPGNIIYKEDMNSDYFCWILGGVSKTAIGNDIFEFVKGYDHIAYMNF
jgi:hypothetical protein